MRDAITTTCEVAGIALIALGIWLVFIPAAFIFTGLAIVALCVWNSK